MNPDQGNLPQTENPKSTGNLWLVWMLLGLAPIPIGLLVGPTNIFNSILGQNNSPFVCYAIVTGILGLTCGIGLLGGFRTRKIGSIAAGIALGCAIAVFCLFAVFFAGCALEIIHK